MDMQGLKCSGCGSSNVIFDPRKRILICNQCGKEEYYSRATLNASGKVVYGKRNAVNFFLNGKYEEARHYALEVLNISIDHAPSLFIMNYYDEFVARRTGAMHSFFDQIMDVPLEYEEVQDLRELFTAAAYNISEYEEQVIRLLALNMQSEEEKKDLCEIVDKLCPYWISRRTSTVFLTKSLIELYQDLAEHCDIPKTCFALLKSIETNPDSPYTDRSFYLTAKTKFFYQRYMQDVGSILWKISNRTLRTKFVGAFQNKCMKYKADAGLNKGGN